jgi:hypothetical protein
LEETQYAFKNTAKALHMSIQIEIRYAPASRSVSNAVAHDIADNHLHGNIVIVSAGNPLYAYAAFRKQWLQVVRAVERERASTINLEKLQVLMPKLAQMRRQRFTTMPERASFNDTVFFTTTGELAQQPRNCRVLYVTHPVSDEALQTIISNMADGGVVVRYLRPEIQSEYEAIKSHPWRITM